MLRKILSIITVSTLCFLFTISAPFTVFAAGVYEEYNCLTQQKKSYTTYNWEEVNKTPSYAGTGNMNYGIQPYQVIDECNLIKIEDTTVTPITRACCQIACLFPNGKYVYGSAVMIGPSTALTAAHCVYQSEWGGYAKSVSVAPARNLSNRPYGYTHSSKISIPAAFKTNGSYGNDIAVLNLQTAIGNKSGYIGCKVISPYTMIDSYNCSIEINGYPGSGYYADLNEQYTKLGEMWGMGGDCIYASGKKMRHTIDTFPGMSGAGIITAVYGTSYPFITGVHDGYPTNNTRYNQGTRIDNEYLTWINGLLK